MQSTNVLKSLPGCRVSRHFVKSLDAMFACILLRDLARDFGIEFEIFAIARFSKSTRARAKKNYSTSEYSRNILLTELSKLLAYFIFAVSRFTM